MRRTWLVLLLLAALFSMHGISSLPGDVGMSEATTASHSVLEVAADGLALSSPALTAVLDEPMDGSGESHHGDPVSHTMTGHLWSLCLAVLLAGAALFVFMRPGRSSPAEQALFGPRRVRRPAGLVAILRPPDLSVLCLLRI